MDKRVLVIIICIFFLLLPSQVIAQTTSTETPDFRVTWKEGDTYIEVEPFQPQRLPMGIFIDIYYKDNETISIKITRFLEQAKTYVVNIELWDYYQKQLITKLEFTPSSPDTFETKVLSNLTIIYIEVYGEDMNKRFGPYYIYYYAPQQHVSYLQEYAPLLAVALFVALAFRLNIRDVAIGMIIYGVVGEIIVPLLTGYNNIFLHFSCGFSLVTGLIILGAKVLREG